MRHARRSLLVPCLFVTVATGCASKARTTDAASPTTAVTASDASDSYAAQLSDLESQMRAAGLQPAGTEDEREVPTSALEQHELAEPSADPSATSADRETNVCDLAEAICDLRERVCDLAGRHPGQSRYVDVCRAARSDCDTANTACEERSDG